MFIVHTCNEETGVWQAYRAQSLEILTEGVLHVLACKGTHSYYLCHVLPKEVPRYFWQVGTTTDWIIAGTHGRGRGAWGCRGRGGGVGVGLVAVGWGLVGRHRGRVVRWAGVVSRGRAAVVEGCRCDRLGGWGLVRWGLVSPVLWVEGLVLIFVLGTPTRAPHLVTHIVVRPHVQLVDGAPGTRHLGARSVEQRSEKRKRDLLSS